MRLWAAAAALALLLGGCADKGGAADEEIDPGLTVTDTTGAIRGLVVTESIVPLPNVTITVNGLDATAKTDQDGLFGFSEVPPGTYFVRAAKPGYADAQTTVEVEAGKQSDLARLTLVATGERLAYLEPTQSHTGYILCTTSVVAVCGAPNVVSDLLLCDVFDVCLGNLTDDRFGFYFYYDENATMVQSEMFWTTTQALSPALSLSMENIEGCEAESNAYVESAEGTSPLHNIADEEDLDAGTIGGACGIFHSVFSGDTGGTPLGFTVQQRFEIFTHAFHGYTPPEGWRFSEHGDPPGPPE